MESFSCLIFVTKSWVSLMQYCSSWFAFKDIMDYNSWHIYKYQKIMILPFITSPYISRHLPRSICSCVRSLLGSIGSFSSCCSISSSSYWSACCLKPCLSPSGRSLGMWIALRIPWETWRWSYRVFLRSVIRKSVFWVDSRRLSM